MINIKEYNNNNQPSSLEKTEISSFLYQHLEEYGDRQQAIEKAMDYTAGENNSPGGNIFVSKNNNKIVAAAVINKTGMHDYIPANILVYIATHKEFRGKGIAKNLVKHIIENLDGDIALHVEP